MSDKFIQFLGLVKKSGNILEGYNKCEEGIKFGKIKLLIIAEDCSDNTKEKFTLLCNKNNISVIKGYDRNELGEILGREEISIIGVTNLSMGKKLIEIWTEKNNV